MFRPFLRHVCVTNFCSCALVFVVLSTTRSDARARKGVSFYLSACRFPVFLYTNCTSVYLVWQIHFFSDLEMYYACGFVIKAIIICSSQIGFRTRAGILSFHCKGKDKASQSSSGCPMREAKTAQLEMAKRQQIQRRIQANMSLFHFISLAEQSSQCNRHQAAVSFSKSKPKRRRRGEFICITTYDRWKRSALVNIRRKALLSSVGFRKRMTSRSPRGSPCDSSKLRLDRPLRFVWWSDVCIEVLSCFSVHPSID